MPQFNPYLQTDLRDVKSQGASVGDRRNYNGQSFIWDGVNWNPSGGSSSSFSSTNTSNPQSYIDAAMASYKKANEPAVANLKASIPEQKTMFANERTRLQGQEGTIKDRYKNLIDSIKGNQQVAETRQTTTTNNELARRGITNDSGVYQQEMTNVLNPITKQYTGLAKDAAISREADLQDLSSRITGLTDQESAAIRSILGNIASLESGAGNNAVSTGLNLFSQDKASEAQSKAAELENALKEATLKIQQGQLANDTARTQYDINKPYSTSNDSGIGSLLSMLGGSMASTQPQKSVIGRLTDGRYLWSDGTAGWTGGK